MRVLIFGISGQDGIILAELLSKKNIDFLGVVRSKDIPKSLSHLRRKHIKLISKLLIGLVEVF